MVVLPGGQTAATAVQHRGDALLDVGLELPVAWVEALIPNGLSGTAAVPRPPLPTSFRPGC